jgi:hypothetical protein
MTFRSRAGQPRPDVLRLATEDVGAAGADAGERGERLADPARVAVGPVAQPSQVTAVLVLQPLGPLPECGAVTQDDDFGPV